MIIRRILLNIAVIFMCLWGFAFCAATEVAHSSLQQSVFHKEKFLEKASQPQSALPKIAAEEPGVDEGAVADIEKEIDQELIEESKGEKAAEETGVEAVEKDGSVEEVGQEELIPEAPVKRNPNLKKTIFIPKLNRTIVIDGGQVYIPGFGRVFFEEIPDKATGQMLLRGCPEKPSMIWGVITVKSAEFVINEETKDFTFNASLYFLKREILRPSVESFSEDGVLRIKCLLPNPIAIPISPWATFVIDAVYLEKDKTQETLKVISQATLKQHPEVKVDFIFLKDPEVGSVVEASLERLPLSYVIAPLAATPFNKITLNKIKLLKKGIELQEEEDVPVGGVSMDGIVNFGGLLSSLSIKVDNVACSLIVGAQKAPITLTAKIPQNLEFIPSLLVVQDPTIVLQYGEPPVAEALSKPSLVAEEQEEVETVAETGKKATMKLLGSVKLSLPVIGDVATKLVSFFKLTGKEKGFTTFTGTLEKPISYAGKVSIDKCQLVLSRRVVVAEDAAQVSQEKPKEEKEKLKGAYKLAISGEGTVNAEDVARVLPTIPGFDVKSFLRQKLLVTLDVVKTPKGLDFAFEGLLAMPKPLKPFEKLPGLEKIQEVRDIEIKRLGLGFDSSMNMYLMGDTKVLGLVARAKFIKTRKGVALVVKPVQEPQITDVVPAAQGTLIQKILLTDLSLVVSSAPYEDETTGEMMPKGLAITASIALSGDLFANVRVLTKGAPEKLTLIGMIGASLNDLILKIKLPMEIAIGPQITCKGVALELAGAGPSISMLGSIAVRPTPQDKQLLFTGRIKVDPDKASGAGTMQGEWKDPLGVKGIAISDCAFEMGIDYSIFSNTGAPTIFGITGGLQLGSVKVMMATKAVIGAGAADSILAGRVNKLDINDLVSVVNAAKVVRIPTEKVPTLKLEDVDITIAPKGGKIGEIMFEQGVTVKGKLSVLDKFALMNITVNPSTGIIGRGAMSKFKLGPLDVTGVGLDGVEGTADDGPVVNIEFTPEKQQVLISGRAVFMDSKAIVEVLVEPLGAEFFIQTKLAKTFNLKLKGSTTTMQATGTLESDFKNFIKEQVVKRLDVSSAAADVVKLREINQRIADLDRRITDKNREIDESKNKVTENVRWEKFTRWEEKTVCVGAGSWRKCHTERIPIPDTRRIVDKIPFDIGPLVVQRGKLEAECAALIGPQKTLQAAVDALKGSTKLVEKTMTSFEVTSASVEGNLIEMQRGTCAVNMKIRAAGQEFEIKFDLDTNDMGKFADDVVAAVKQKFHK